MSFLRGGSLQKSRYDCVGADKREGKLYHPTMAIKCTCGVRLRVDVDYKNAFGREAYETVISAWNTRIADRSAESGEAQKSLERLNNAYKYAENGQFEYVNLLPKDAEIIIKYFKGES